MVEVLPPLPLLLRRRAQLGSLLLRDGLITPEQLELALAEKETGDRRLGEILVANDFASGAEVARALAEQHELEFVDLAHAEIDPQAVALLPEKLARRYGALPVRFLSEEVILVAVADPTDVLASDDLRLALGVQIRLAVVSGPDLARALGRVYRTSVDVEALEHSAPEGDLRQMEDIRDSAAASSAPAIKLANSIIARAIDEGASDIHFEPQADGMVVRARIDGVMRRIADVPKTLQPAVTSRLKIMGELDIADRRSPQDGRVSIRFGGSPMDLRIAVLPTTHGEQIVLRILHRASGRLDLTELGMSPAALATFERAIRQPFGAVIACGPTGSGKTTTLYAALDALNDDERVLTTIEDPVEYQIPGVNQIEVSSRAEVPDEETARIAIQAAMTGHLVLTSLHTHNAASSIARLKDMAVEPGLLATSLNCIVAQRLARRLCLECREPYEPDETDLPDLGGSLDAPVYEARGCVDCAGTGYAGRVALYEVMPIHGRIRRLIEASTEEIFAAAVEAGMTTLREDGIRLVRAGISSLDEIRRVTGDRLI